MTSILTDESVGSAPDSAPAEWSERLRTIESSLVCPACRQPLRLEGGALVGTACAHRYPVRDGIAHLALLGAAETWDAASADADSRRYQQNYQQVADAEVYNRGYQAKTSKRATTRRELSLLRTLLGSQGRSGALINLPCGGGRLSRPIAESTDLLIEADIAVGQLLYGASRRDWATPEVRMTASAFHIPLRDRGVDGAVCIRLCHHLPTSTERARLLTELLRVADRFVLMTFFDHRSLKNRLRRARRRFDHKPPKHTMRVEEVARIAALNGFALHRCPPISRLGSGHRYALLVRSDGASTPLRIRARESRIDLPSIPGGVANGLLVDVPAKPIKADRGTVVFPWPPEGNRRMILKVYGQMGVFNWLRKQVVGYRARREFRTLALLRAAGIDCCEPLVWGTGRSDEHGLFEMLATREIDHVVTFEQQAASLAPEVRLEVLARVFEQLARMHQAGVYHGAPYLSNVLLRAEPLSGGGIVMVDLEKSVCYARDIRGSRMASFDLLNLVNATRVRMGADHARVGLARYGLDAAASERVFGAATAFRSSKFQRYRRRAEFLARGVLSRALRRRRAVPAGVLEPSVGSPRP